MSNPLPDDLRELRELIRPYVCKPMGLPPTNHTQATVEHLQRQDERKLDDIMAKVAGIVAEAKANEALFWIQLVVDRYNGDISENRYDELWSQRVETHKAAIQSLKLAALNTNAQGKEKHGSDS